jgi:prolyl-tRNA editing enzyme YbaK/EbsC (Cys-tRNA(Pro) deacylase)
MCPTVTGARKLIMAEISPSMKRVQEALDKSGLSLEIVELPQSTRTAQEAADAVGGELGQIVKSLIFRGSDSNKPYLVLVSGHNRADLELVGQLVGESVRMADADYVREQTGFSIGGVAPVGLPGSIQTLIDQDLLQYQTIWAAAGTPRSVFSLSPDNLLELTEGQVARID